MILSDLPAPRSASAGDRRGARRAATVLLVGKLHDGSTTTPCLVLNLSETGLMARIGVTARVGQHVAVELRGIPPTGATIRWIDGARAGLEFDSPQSLVPVFHPLSADGRIARPPRFDVSLEAVLRIAGRGLPVRLVNLSTGGARLSAATALERGQAGQIVVPGRDIGPFGSIRWVVGGELGFHFSTPLPLDTLTRSLARRTVC